MSVFTKLEGPFRPSLSVCSSGHEKRGKTFWALSAPGPIAIIASDPGAESAIRQWQAAGKEILCFLHTLPVRGQSMDVYEQAWARVAAAIDEAVASKHFRTIVFDTATEVWELLRLARFGRLTQVMPHHYGPVNAEFRAIFHRVSKSGKNSVWIHKVKKEYATNREGKDGWTGRYERSGFGGFEYLVDLVVEHDIQQDGAGAPEFCTRILESRYNPSRANGMVVSGQMSTFPMVASMVLPDVDSSCWDDGIPSPASE